MAISLKVDLTSRDDGHKSIRRAVLMDRNIILPEGEEFPHLAKGQRYMRFTSEYSEVYTISEGGPNTRLSYPTTEQGPGHLQYFCKLNWFQRRLLAIIERRTWMHKQPVATVALLVSLLSLVLSTVAILLRLPK